MVGVIVHMILGLVSMISILLTQDSEERKKKLEIKALGDARSGKRITTFNTGGARQGSQQCNSLSVLVCMTS